QAEPFQCSISECAPSGSTPDWFRSPTAHTSDAVPALTASSWMLPLKLVTAPGLATWAQCAPFQCSTSVRVVWPDPDTPTAHALVGETAETPFSAIAEERFAVGMDAEAQAAWAVPAPTGPEAIAAAVATAGTSHRRRMGRVNGATHRSSSGPD